LNRLIITNGSAAADVIRAAGIEGEVLSWNDVLHDGPVPSRLNLDELSEVRARYISSLGWGDSNGVLAEFVARDNLLKTAPRRDEVVCWFEHDLYDQLQLWQVIDALGSMNVSATLICRDAFIGYQSSTQLTEDFEARTEVTRAQFTAGSTLWDAFRQSDPEVLAREPEAALNFTTSTISRWAQCFPSTSTGLNRSERFMLEYLDGRSGSASFGDLFRALLAQEEAAFMGDTSLFVLLSRLSSFEPSLIRLQGDDASLPAVTIGLTDAGRNRLKGGGWSWDSASDRWIGGVHLKKSNQWLWNPESREMERRAEE